MSAERDRDTLPPDVAVAYHRMAASCFPLKLEAFLPDGTLVWTARVERPDTRTYVPPLARLHGKRVRIRITWGDGRVSEK